MPVIPTFDVDVGVATPQPVHADPQAFMAPGEALASVGRQITDFAQPWAQRYAEAKRQQTAAGLVASGTSQLNDAAFSASKIPDSAAAYDQFGQQAEAIRKSVLAQTNDPLVQAHVDDTLRLHTVLRQESVRDRAFQLESSAHVADLQSQHLPQYAQTIADPQTTPELRAATLDQMDADLAGSTKAGWIAPEAGVVMRSAALRDAVELRMVDDPIGAKTLLAGLTGRLTAGDMAHAEMQLRSSVPRRQAEDAVQAVTGGAAGGPATPETLDNNIGNIRASNVAWDGKGAPSGGFETFATPEAGARAAMQNIRSYERKNGAALTLTDLITRWAPPSENDTDGYIQAVAKQTGIDPKAPLNTSDAAQMQSVLGAMNQHEKGRRTIGDDALAAGIGSALNGTPLDNQPSDIGQQLQQVRARVADLPLWAQDHAEAVLLRRYHDTLAAQSGERGDLERSVSNLQQAYLQGVTGDEPPEDDIRRLYPPGKAEEILQRLDISRQAGDLFSGVKYASPQQEQAAQQLLATPGTLAAGRVVVRNHQVVPPVAGAGSVEPGAETPDQMKLRSAVANEYQRLLDQKHQALLADPAGYAATQPDVAAAIKAQDPNDPASRQAVLGKLLDAQAALGVPDDARRVLTNAEVARTVHDWTTSDPATTDIGARVDGLRAQYGDLAPRAFHDLVTVGKLAPQWQVIAAMTEPEQMAGRAELIRTLQATAQPGGQERLEKALPADAKKTIDRNLIEDLAPFRQTMMVPGGPTNLDLVNGVQEAVRGLAYANTLKGQGAEAALQSAVDSVLNAKYDFDGTLRTPKGQMAAAQTMGRQLQYDLKGSDVRAPAQGDPALTAAQNAEVVTDAAKRDGVWVTNPRDDGAVLMTTLRNGARVPVIRADGTPVGFKWADLANVPSRDQRAPGATAPTLGGEDPAQQANVPGWRPHWPTGPDMGHVTNRPVGAALGDWFRGTP